MCGRSGKVGGFGRATRYWCTTQYESMPCCYNCNVPQWGGTNLVIFARALFGTLTVRVGNVTAVAGQLTVLTS